MEKNTMLWIGAIVLLVVALNYGAFSGAIVSTPTYTDASLSSGVIYYYAVTSVDSGGLESAMSSSVSAQTLIASCNADHVSGTVSSTYCTGTNVMEKKWTCAGTVWTEVESLKTACTSTQDCTNGACVDKQQQQTGSGHVTAPVTPIVPEQTAPQEPPQEGIVLPLMTSTGGLADTYNSFAIGFNKQTQTTKMVELLLLLAAIYFGYTEYRKRRPRKR